MLSVLAGYVQLCKKAVVNKTQYYNLASLDSRQITSRGDFCTPIQRANANRGCIFDGMYLSINRAEMILKLLVERSSVNMVERITGVHHSTILKLLILAGEHCEKFLAEKISNLNVRDVQVDEIWGYVQKKELRRARGG